MRYVDLSTGEGRKEIDNAQLIRLFKKAVEIYVLGKYSDKDDTNFERQKDMDNFHDELLRRLEQKYG